VPWRQSRLAQLEKDLDWSRCFASVLFVDSPCSPSYVRARLAQRLLDALVEWNGIGKVVEVFACTPLKEGAGSDDSVSPGKGFFWPTGAASDFAEHVGLDAEQLDQILRKLGAGWSASLCDDDLREHAVIVALDRKAHAAVATEMKDQGLDPANGTLLLFSDFVWHLQDHWTAIQSASCLDGSGAAFLDDGVLRILRRCNFEQKSSVSVDVNISPDAASLLSASSVSAELDMPAWPRLSTCSQAESATGDAGLPGQWRRLHCSLLRGTVGLLWFLARSWQAKYCNPLQSGRGR